MGNSVSRRFNSMCHEKNCFLKRIYCKKFKDFFTKKNNKENKMLKSLDFKVNGVHSLLMKDFYKYTEENLNMTKHVIKNSSTKLDSQEKQNNLKEKNIKSPKKDKVDIFTIINILKDKQSGISNKDIEERYKLDDKFMETLGTQVQILEEFKNK
ncbi:hypothetical protein PORY_000081 [Pneumocystis oryctolagi]|uniref:Uncharacterized protein n=1 Tax=Pneumocystis oryctolagi TaxID=42067 RepID=A0ACB7CGA6_9ASCO|nr:hypothetical protein PORY_000081 [Pneumocystis oryctolagi]